MAADKLPSLWRSTVAATTRVSPLGGSGAGRPRFRVFDHSGMMKQILLCVAAMVAKIGLRKRAKLLRRDLFGSREILLSQNALDPDIDWKSAPTFVGKKHDTIRDLRAHAWQCTELFSKIGIGKRRPRFQISRA